MGDLIVLAAIAVVVFFVVRSMVKDHKNGKHCSGCSGTCSSCSAGCHKKDEE